MVKILDKNGQPLEDTTRNGKVRRLLKDKKARVVNGNPFTIQLLYDTVLDSEDITMNAIIVSNDITHKPKGLVSKDEQIEMMTFDEFITKATEPDGLVIDSLYIDVDGLSRDVYVQLKNCETFPDNITFFRYKLKPDFIDDKVKFVDALDVITSDRADELKVKFSDDIITNGSILINGMIGTGKTTLCKNIVTQLKKKEVEIDYATPIPVYDASVDDDDDIYKHTTNVKELADLLVSYQTEMMDRFKKMESASVNSAYKLKEPVKTKVIIIDGLNEYMCNDDYRSVDKIKNTLGSIARLGRAAGIMLILTCERPGGNVISTDLFNNIINRVNVGKIADVNVSQLMFDEDLHINIPSGMGIYQSAFSAGESEYSIFSIDNVKNF